MYYLTLSGKLFIAPVAEEKLHRVLDLGTGTGIWAIDFGNDLPPTPFASRTKSFQLMSIPNHKYDEIKSCEAMLTGIKVTGVDLSPIQPELYYSLLTHGPQLIHFSVPPNCSFEIDDIEEPWTYRFKFDFIHVRMMVGSVGSFPRLFEQSLE